MGDSTTSVTAKILPEVEASAETDFIGHYSLPYNLIVRPARVWRVSKYFLRRWVPYLGPKRFWLIIAAQQLAYDLDGARQRFQAYDAAVYTAVPVGKTAFYDLKAEMALIEKETEAIQPSKYPLSLFVARKETEYERTDSTTKARPTKYWVRLDDVLTPGDATHLKVWFNQQGPCKSSADVLALLELAHLQNKTTLLAPSQSPYLNTTETYHPITVLDIVRDLFSPKLITPEVLNAAQALHKALTQGDYVGKQYFRQQYLHMLGAGPALLLTYFRAACYHRAGCDQAPRKIRDKVTFTHTELGDYLHVDTKTISRWLKTLEKAVLPGEGQLYAPFLTRISKKRTSSNDVEFTCRVLVEDDPIHPDHMLLYLDYLRQAQAQPAAPTFIRAEASGDGQNRTHTDAQTPEVMDKTELTPIDGVGWGDGQNRTYTHAQIPGVTDKTELAWGGNGQNRTGSGTKPNAIIKHYKHYSYSSLCQALNINEAQLRAAAVDPFWKIGVPAGTSFARAAVGDIRGFCGAVHIVEPGISRLIKSTLTLEQIVAWYLYVLQKLPAAIHLGYVINRGAENAAPPAPFELLANLSWESWRSYAVLLPLPPVFRASFSGSPGYQEWMAEYEKKAVTALPFGVGKGVIEFLEGIEGTWYSEKRPSDPRSDLTAVNDNDTGVVKEVDGACYGHTPDSKAKAMWRSTLDQVGWQMTKATFNAWLKGAALVGVENNDGNLTYVIGVRNSYAQDWVENRLKDVIQKTLQAVADTTAVKVRFVVGDS